MAKKFQNFFGACFRYTLHKLKQIFWKKTKMTKCDDFCKFLPKFTSAWKQKKDKNDNCVLTLRLLSEMAKKIQKIFSCMF